MNRRGFLGSIIALGAAPAIVRAYSLMRIVPMETVIVRVAHPLYGIASITGGTIFAIEDVTMTIGEYMALQVGRRMQLTKEMIAYRAIKDAR